VQNDLAKKYSPVQISGRLRVEFPERPEMQVSQETIYQSVYLLSRGGLKRELVTELRTGRVRRKSRREPEQRRGKIRDMVMIADRPAEVEDRAIPGDWEGDLIVGKDNKSAIGTIVERSTGYLMLLHLPAGTPRVEAVRDGLIDKMGALPDILRRSLTWDQGAELTQHAQLRIDTGVQIYFCDPHSPWQRGTNENTNGLLRQYFPKGTDLSMHSADALAAVATTLNGRPRKTLGWRTPAEALDELMKSAHTDVATTG
jgi:IS30 family transposase